jgi:signal peptidase II
MQKVQDNGRPSELTSSKETDFARDDKSETSPGKHRARLRLFLIVSGLTVLLDQLSKLWIATNRPQAVLLPGFLDLVYFENTGAVFGLFHGHTQVFIGLGIASVIAILVFLYYFPPTTTVGVLSFALILGGALGNLIDRIRLGYVIDFLRLHVQDIFFWPAFNVADAALTVGLLALIYYFYKYGSLRKAHERHLKAQD